MPYLKSEKRFEVKCFMAHRIVPQVSHCSFDIAVVCDDFQGTPFGYGYACHTVNDAIFQQLKCDMIRQRQLIKHELSLCEWKFVIWYLVYQRWTYDFLYVFIFILFFLSLFFSLYLTKRDTSGCWMFQNDNQQSTLQYVGFVFNWKF